MTKKASTGIGELDRVLGGGLAPAMVVLLGGDPGIGKSTLLLQAAHSISNTGKVLYITGEESAEQIKLRADRLGVKGELLLLAESNLALIEAEAERTGAICLIIDSIQTMSCDTIAGAVGSVSQVREATSLLTRYAKRTNTAVLIVGHVTKDGAIAGPRILEHMVDTVLYFEGDRHADMRLLRAVKNRFGSTNEIGVFEMCDRGMREVSDPSHMFLSGGNLPGCAVSCALEGSRPILLEVQSLLSPTAFGSPRRAATGVDSGRLNLLLAVLEQKARLRLSDKDVYINIVGGLKILDRAIDLSVAMCISSAYKETSLPKNTAMLGEIGLTGEIRPVSQMDKRIRECVRLGFTDILLPRLSHPPQIPGANLIPLRNVAEAVAYLS